MNLITRTDAARAGLKHYFTGKPCVHGHTMRRKVSTRHCIGCVTQDGKDRRAADPVKHRDHVRRAHAKRRGYAFPPLEKDCPPRPEDGKCQCCEKVCPLVLDHDHHIGAFRGWTCGPCNTALGRFGDSMVGMRRAVQYMAKFYLTGKVTR